MSKATTTLFTPQAAPLPDFPSQEKVEFYLNSHPCEWKIYSELPSNLKQELIDFCTGKHGLKVTYDPVFRRIFNPSLCHSRLEALLSAILDRPLRIIKVIPREGMQLNEQASFVVIDVLVQLDDGSFANVEMQKIGYSFPLARADCYASDIIMRQYSQAKQEQGKTFSFQNLHKVYCIILMEKSPREFHSVKNKYIHRRTSSFDTNIYQNSAGLHEDIFICLDSFHSIVHNITKDSTNLEAWLTFLSATDAETITSLINAFPCFAAIYQEITDFVKNPEEIMNMLSEALYIMDKNMERLMVTELQEEVNALKAERDAAMTEKHSIISEINSVMNARNSAIAERNSVITERDSAIAERDSVITERDSAIAERDSVITERDSAIAERDSIMAEYLAVSTKLQRILDFLKSHGYQEEI